MLYLVREKIKETIDRYMSKRMNKIKIGQTNTLVLTKQENLFAVRETDLRRLKRVLDRCIPILQWWHFGASFCLGITTSAAIASVTAFIQNEKVVGWCLCFVGVSFAIIAIICYIAHNKEKDIRQSSIDDIREIVQDIEQGLNTIGATEA